MAALLDRTSHFFAGAGASIARAVATGLAGGGKKLRQTGERLFAGLNSFGGMWTGQPGSWGTDRIEQARHFRLWTYVAVRAIAEQIARMPPKVGYRLGPEEVEARGGKKNKRLVPPKVRQKALTSALQPHEEIEAVDSDHPMYRLLQNPNKPDVQYSFWYRTIMALELTGECYWIKIRNRAGRVTELWVMPSHWVWPVAGSQRLVDYYEIRPYAGGGARTITFPPEDVVPFCYPSPMSLVRGWSPLFACAEWIDCNEAIAADRWYSFRNGQWPGMVIELQDPPWGKQGPQKAEVDRLYAMLDERLRGKEKAARPIMFNPGMKPIQMTRTNVEMAYEQSAQGSRDEVLAAHRVSKTVAGITEDVNRAAMIGSLANFIEGTCAPKFTFMGQVITEHVAAEFDEDLLIYWPHDVPKDAETERADLAFQAERGAVTPNEIRTHFGREPYEFGGDDPVLPAGLAPVPWATGEVAEGDELALLLGQAAQAPPPGQEGGEGGPPPAKGFDLFADRFGRNGSTGNTVG